ncbi:MAG TPA: hypothetical protein VM345_08260 [Acidimicrobiales bacterium]|nr:hypothetical protein [Acidimicrobiales bacterium]
MPLFYTRFSTDGARIAMQTAVAIVAWLAAAGTVASWARSRVLRLLAFVAVLLIGASPLTTVWHLAVLSESLSTSLSMFLLTAAAAAAARPTRLRFAALAVATLLWAFARHINIAVLAASLPVLVGVTFRTREHRKLMAAYTLLSIVIVLWGGRAFFAESYITTYNSTGLLFDRVLTKEEGQELVAERGLDVPAELRPFVGNYAPNAPAVLNSRVVYEWIETKWTGTYAKWLLTQHEETWMAPLRQAPHLLAGAILYSPARQVLPHQVANLSGDMTRTNLVVWVALPLAASLTALPARIRSRRREAVLIGWFFAAAIFTYYAVWWLSSTDLGRLMSPVAILGRVLSIAALVVAIDTLAPARQQAARRQFAAGPTCR